MKTFTHFFKDIGKKFTLWSPWEYFPTETGVKMTTHLKRDKNLQVEAFVDLDNNISVKVLKKSYPEAVYDISEIGLDEESVLWVKVWVKGYHNSHKIYKNLLSKQ